MTSPSRYLCPRCRIELENVHLQEPMAEFHHRQCRQCRGRLMAVEELQSVEETVEPRLIELRRLPSAEEQAQPLHCPRCETGEPMSKYAHPRDKRVIVDRCDQCRTIWLDGGELRAIQEESLPVFVANTFRFFGQLL